LSELFQKVALAIQRYQNSDWVWIRIVYGEETHAPILAFYNSAADKTCLPGGFAITLAKGAMMSSDDERCQDLPRNFLWFYHALRQERVQARPSSRWIEIFSN